MACNRTMKMAFSAGACIVVAFFVYSKADAYTYWDTVVRNAAVVVDTALGNLTAQEEVELIGRNWDEYNREKRAEGLVSIGQVAKDGNYPVNLYAWTDIGTTEILTYFFIDPATGLPTDPAFTVAGVRYEALLSPPTLDKSLLTEQLIKDSLVVLGVSNDASSNFAFNFTLAGFEPMILAFPMDVSGNDITGEGTAGFASNVLTPEPCTLALVGVGAIGAVCMRRRRPAGKV